ncbi:hypothetical protein BJF78_34675 [Pseudonocardia sp. CNS-139]|nr:hypothetical protein BJF78_34675 [Pseudonocardia sp. CNS-139]
MARRSQEEREERLAEIKQAYEDRLAKIASDPTLWVEFIEGVAAFGARYSLANQILLEWQAVERDIEPRYFLPYGGKDGRSGWLGMGRQVRKGERSFAIWAPVRRRPTEDEARKIEALGRKVPRDELGRPMKMLMGFRLSSTFELSQTEGSEPFEVPSVQVRRRKRVGPGPVRLEGEDPTGAFDDVIGLLAAQGYRFELVAPRSKDLGTANGRTWFARRLVVVDETLAPAQRIKTTIHELAHIRCNHETRRELEADLHQGRRETEAESVAHIVCLALGLDSQRYTDAYVLGWAGGDMELVNDCMGLVLQVAKAILADLDPGESAEPADVAAGDEASDAEAAA